MTDPIANKKRNVLLRIIFHSAKIPLIYLILGLTFIGLSYIDDIFSITSYKNLFTITDKMGSMLISLSILTLIYNFIVLSFWHYEKKLDSNQHLLALVISNLRKGLRIIFILIAINIFILLVGPNTFYLSLADNIIKTIIIASIGWIAIQLFYTFEAAVYQQMMRLSREEGIKVKALYTKMHIIRNLATVVILIITIAAILMSFSSVKNIGISLLASAGFLTAIAGLAAQKTLFSLFAGLQLALSQMIKIGDTVVIENTTGTIEEISFTYITLKLADKRRLVLPINYFIDKPFQNWSQDGGNFKDYVYFYIDFMMPIEPLRQELDTILQASPHWDGQLKKLQVSDLTDHAVQISVQMSARTADHLAELRSEIREKLLSFINQYYPQYLPKIRFPTQYETGTS